MRVAIIGAGICGLYLAWKLAEKGEDVTVFEKKGKIGKEVCSGLFSERILEFIPHLSKEYDSWQKSNIWQKGAGFIPQSQGLIQNQINYCLIHFPQKTIKIKFSRKFFILSHYQLDNLVASLAEKSGAKIFLNQNLAMSNIARLENFERIIGCDGANSIVREYLRLKKPNFRLGIQGFVRKSNYSNFVEVWPTKNGFLWKIPRGKEIEYGIIEGREVAKKLFQKFLNENKLSLERLNSAIIPQGLSIPKSEKITLCGDASGLTKPWSGGGVIWGLTAATILLRNFPDFLKYQKEIKKFFRPKIALSKIAKKLVYFLGFNFPWILPKNIEIEGDFLV